MVVAIDSSRMTEATSMTTAQSTAKEFYDRQFEGEVYTPVSTPESHGAYATMKALVERHGLIGKRVVEVGCVRGAFQDLVEDYTAVDYTPSVKRFIRKRFVEASATSLPFADSEFDGAWTVWTLEHVPDPERAFEELRRVVKPGGVLLLCPAWHCRPWAAEGYPVRPYSDFGLQGRLIKASLMLRETRLWQAATIFPGRARRAAERLVSGRGPTRFRYGLLKPQYETFWMADSDALNAMDQFECIVWFTSRGDECLSHPTGVKRFLAVDGAVVIRVRKR